MGVGVPRISGCFLSLRLDWPQDRIVQSPTATAALYGRLSLTLVRANVRQFSPEHSWILMTYLTINK